MKITVIAENTALCDAIGAEHGLSLWIETAEKTILFDMGQTDLYAKNAGKLGLDLCKADLAVVSHGHYDHGGGLAHFLSVNNHAPVYISRHAFGEYYNASGKYIGLDAALATSPRLIFTEGTTQIAENLTLFDCNERCRKGKLGAFGLTRKENGAYLTDDFRHEQYLLIEENGRRVLVSGCSHKGISDIAAWFCPDVLVGGFHVSKLEDPAALADLADELNALPTAYYTCHCTGAAQTAVLQAKMPRLYGLSGGQTICL